MACGNRRTSRLGLVRPRKVRTVLVLLLSSACPSVMYIEYRLFWDVPQDAPPPPSCSLKSSLDLLKEFYSPVNRERYSSYPQCCTVEYRWADLESVCASTGTVSLFLTSSHTTTPCLAFDWNVPRRLRIAQIRVTPYGGTA